MKQVGMIRRIDDLGRIVIPKEIRRLSGIKEGDPMEIKYSCDDGIIISKYKPFNQLRGISQEFADTIQSMLKLDCLIGDLESIHTSNTDISRTMDVGNYSKVIYKPKGDSIVDMLHDGKTIIINNDEIIEHTDHKNKAIIPMFSEHLLIGVIVILSKEEPISELEVDITSSIAQLLIKQIIQ